jgi:hypothetical protein
VNVEMPTWAGRLSPIFDIARRLLMVDVGDAVEGRQDCRSVSDLLTV